MSTNPDIHIDTTLSDHTAAINDQLNANYNNIATTNARTNVVIQQQADVSNLLNNEYNRLSQKKASVDLALTGQRRFATLNENYRERFAAYTKILIIFIFTIIIVLFINYFRQFIVFIPGFLIDFIIVVVCIIGTIMAYLSYITILTRDDIYFNELKLQPPTIDTSANTAASGSSSNLLPTGFGMCIGSGCCDNKKTFWDSVQGICTNTSSYGSSSTAFTTLDLAYTTGQISKADYLKQPVKANTPIEFNDYAVYN